MGQRIIDHDAIFGRRIRSLRDPRGCWCWRNGRSYRGRDPRIGRDVAIKVLAAKYSEEPARLSRFQQEARAAGMLNHPNILAIYDVGIENGCPYLVTELLEGEMLRQKLNASSLPMRKALDYALQIIKGLSAAHEKGIIHRDLKPENLFITKDGRVKILDFDLAKLINLGAIDPDQSKLQTAEIQSQAGTIIGTIVARPSARETIRSSVRYFCVRRHPV